MVVLATLALYVSAFATLDAQSTLFPRLIAFPLIALVLGSLGIQTLPPLAGLRGVVDGSAQLRLARLALGPLFVGLYIALWEPLGFQLDTILFLTLTPTLLGLRRPIALVTIALGTALLFAFLFHLGSGAILPSGILRVEWP